MLESVLHLNVHLQLILHGLSCDIETIFTTIALNFDSIFRYFSLEFVIRFEFCGDVQSPLFRHLPYTRGPRKRMASSVCFHFLAAAESEISLSIQTVHLDQPLTRGSPSCYPRGSVTHVRCVSSAAACCWPVA